MQYEKQLVNAINSLKAQAEDILSEMIDQETAREYYMGKIHAYDNILKTIKFIKEDKEK